MIDLSDLLIPESVTERIVTDRKALFLHIGTVAAQAHGLDSRVVVDRLVGREKLGSTGFGGGTATPHAKIPGLPRVLGVFTRLSQPIDLKAVDDLPVDLVFALLSPPEAGAEHLRALARVSRALRDTGFVAKLRGAGSCDALFALLATGEARDAA